MQPLSNRINTAAVYQTIALSVMSFRELLYIVFWECDKMKNFWKEVINKNLEYPVCDHFAQTSRWYCPTYYIQQISIWELKNISLLILQYFQAKQTIALNWEKKEEDQEYGAMYVYGENNVYFEREMRYLD